MGPGENGPLAENFFQSSRAAQQNGPDVFANNSVKKNRTDLSFEIMIEETQGYKTVVLKNIVHSSLAEHDALENR